MIELPTLKLEEELYEQSVKYVVGVDEAGRGPLAGDVYAAAVILPRNFDPKGINDSKKLTEKKREELFDYITKNALSYGIGKATPQEIDKINIRNAAFLAMRRAVEKIQTYIKSNSIHLLIDGNAFQGFGIPFTTITQGDSKSLSIAAASILAKVSRDRAMRKLDKLHPEYGFAKHKGYPTKAHYAAIQNYGILPEHRKSFKLYKGIKE